MTVTVSKSLPYAEFTGRIYAGEIFKLRDLEPGELIAFSGAHLDASTANQTGLTRVSLETPTLRVADVIAGRGAANVEGHSAWTAPGWFQRISEQRNLADILGCERICPYLEQ